jgi:hypothetical protein
MPGGFAWEVLRRLEAYRAGPPQPVSSTLLRGGPAPVVLIEPGFVQANDGLLFR